MQTSPVKLYGNLICASVGFLIVFLTSIFVAKHFYDDRINVLLENLTILKDYHYSSWGQFPGAIPADYTYTLTPYSIEAYNHSSPIISKAVDPISFNYTYKYQEVSFGQGNQGFIRYKDSWKLVALQNMENKNITTVNLGAQKVYGYEYYSPISRRFAIMFNNLWKNVKQILLPFYAMTLHEFYIKNQVNVYHNIFQEAELDQQLMDQIYNHELYGWKTPKTFEIWVKLCNRKDRASIQEYEILRDTFSVSASQLQRLVGQKSFLNVLTLALNGTLKAKVEDILQTHYELCSPYCSDEQLLAFQFSTGLLTKEPIFNSVNIDKKTNEILTIIPYQIELSAFCATLTDKVCVSGANSYVFFTQQLLGNFSIINQVFENKENLNIIEALLNIADPSGNYQYAESMVLYVDYLQNNIFTPINQETSIADPKAFDYLFNNYLYINSTIQHFKQILNIQLHARALKNIIDQQTLACSSFFAGQYATFASLCLDQSFDLQSVGSVRRYVQAYFFIQRQSFLLSTKMLPQQAASFLRLDKSNSLFALKMDLIRTTFATTFQCQEVYCSEDEMVNKEWSGSNEILTNLPAAFFTKTSVSIVQWDTDNKLKGTEPQYHKIMNQKISQEDAANLLSLQGDATSSILHPFTLFNYKQKAQSGDDISKKLLTYVHKAVIDSYFKGPFSTISLNQAIFGLKAGGIKQKGEMDSLQGGAPWLEEKVSLVETEYKSKRFNKMNTGIYDRSKLRRMIQQGQRQQVGTYYRIFEGQYDEVESFIASKDNVYGTNMLGFHSDIGYSESLYCYLNFANQAVVLNPIVDDLEFNGLKTIKYSIQAQSSPNVGLAHQNERFITINPSSYFIVDPISGTTLDFKIQYSLNTKNTFLQYYFPKPIQSIKLYDMKVEYSRKDIQDLNEIINQKANLFTFYIVAMVLSIVSMISIIVSTILYRMKLKVKKSILKDTLVTDSSISSYN